MNTPQKRCERGQGQVPPLRLAPGAVFLVTVAPLQIANTAWRCRLGGRGNTSRVLPGDIWSSGAKQCKCPILGNRKQAGVRPGKGAATREVWGAEPGDRAHPAVRLRGVGSSC